ncbi:MAG: TonB family protein [Pseudoxanthomonas sp.]|nr:TonB family protein [Pseudoxanthomonas sp.]
MLLDLKMFASRMTQTRALVGLLVVGIAVATPLVVADAPDEKPDDRIPIEVTLEERAAYWQPVQPRTRREVGMVPMEEFERMRSGHVEVEFLIDREGKVRDIVILDSSPPGMWDEHARVDLAGFEYAPTPENAERHPVRVRQRFTYEPRQTSRLP